MYKDDRRYTRENLVGLAVTYNTTNPHPHGPLGWAKDWEYWVNQEVEGDTERPTEDNLRVLRTHLPA